MAENYEQLENSKCQFSQIAYNSSDKIWQWHEDPVTSKFSTLQNSPLALTSKG
jgi:hypothetical protein